MGLANWAGAEAWADAGPIAQIVWRCADWRRVVKGNVLGGGVSTGTEWYERGEGAKLLHGGGVFFAGVTGSRAPPIPTGLADWEHVGASAWRVAWERARLSSESPHPRRNGEEWGARKSYGNDKSKRAGRMPALQKREAMRMQKNSGRNGGAEVLGTLSAVHAPLVRDFQFVKFRTTGEVARLTLDRPEHNLLNERMLAEVAAGINSLSERSEVKLIVMDSAGKAFSGGIELGEYTQRRVFQLLDAFHNAFSAMLDTSKPVLVVINGPAYGGGAELAALGDLVIATPRARFAQPEIKLGAFPPLAAAILPYILGPKLALEQVLTGEVMTAERAREVGLVNWLVSEEELPKKVDELIAKVTAQSGPVLTMAKKAILGSLGLPLRDGVRNSMRVFLNELGDLEDSQEGLRAQVEKRAPKWKNR
jgi:cyclohexa-1,5-dienecarbonyl-CoA hydratase